MKRILVFLVILPLLCCAVLGAGAEEVPCAYAVTTKNNVNIRADSTVSSQSLAIIPLGDTVGVIRAEMSGTELWYRIVYGRLYGYIRGDLLKFPNNNAPMPVVTPVPYTAPPVTPAVTDPVYGTWQEAYRALITGSSYKLSGVSAYTFYLHDLNGDAVPELAIRSDYGIEQLAFYTFSGGKAVQIGSMGGNNFFQWIYYFGDDRFPGLYVSVGGPGMDVERCTWAGGAFLYERVGSTIVETTADGTQETVGFNDYLGSSADLLRMLADSGYGYRGPARIPRGFTEEDLLTGNKWNDFIASAFASNIPWDEEKVGEFALRCYQIALGREPGKDETAAWVSMVMDGRLELKMLPYGFIDSDEFRARGLSSEDLVRILYSLYLQREPDAGGLANWVQQLDGGASLEAVTGGFADSAEFSVYLDSMLKE